MSTACPYCDSELDANYCVEHKGYAKPKDHDFNVCAYCGEISLFTHSGDSLRKIFGSDKDFLKENEQVFNNVKLISLKVKNDIALKALKVFNNRLKVNLN